jgi:hypothetical protein
VLENSATVPGAPGAQVKFVCVGPSPGSASAQNRDQHPPQIVVPPGMAHCVGRASELERYIPPSETGLGEAL